jgi:diguanylate cyclase (GGDEF)-like protein
MMIDEHRLGILHLRCAGPAALEPRRFAARAALAERVANLVGACLVNIRPRESLKSRAVRDPLTRLYNRRFFDETLGRELANARRGDSTVALMLLDIDRFKSINDRHGHEAGDVVLAGFAEFLAGNVRAGDVACRYGGEEFALIMPSLAPQDARRRAEAIRAGLGGWRLETLPPELAAVTVSIGVAVYPRDGISPRELIGAADRALYRAKRSGRDCVAEAEPRPVP